MVSTCLDLSHGVPHATYRRVFERVNPEALQRCFLGWVSQVVKQAGAGYPDRRQVHEGPMIAEEAIGLACGECLGK